MGHYKLLFEDEYLGAHDLKGRAVQLTIARVEREVLKREDGTESKPVLHFREMQDRPKDKRKRLILGKFTGSCIARLYGTDADAWAGKHITVYPAECDSFGERAEAVRIHVPGFVLMKSGNKLRRLKHDESDPVLRLMPQRNASKPATKPPSNDPPPEREPGADDEPRDPRDADAP